MLMDYLRKSQETDEHIYWLFEDPYKSSDIFGLMAGMSAASDCAIDYLLEHGILSCIAAAIFEFDRFPKELFLAINLLTKTLLIDGDTSKDTTDKNYEVLQHCKYIRNNHDLIRGSFLFSIF